MSYRNALFALCASGLLAASSGCASVLKNTDPNFDPRADRAEKIQEAILKQRCTFAAIVVRNEFRDQVTLYAIRSPGTGNEQRLGYLQAADNDRVICIEEGSLASGGMLILAADAPPRRDQLGQYDILDYQGLSIHRGSIYEVMIHGNMWNLTYFSYVRFLDAGNIVFPQPKSKK